MWQELIAFLTIISIIAYSVQIIKNHKQLYILLFVTLVLTVVLSSWLEIYKEYEAHIFNCHCNDPDYNVETASETVTFDWLQFIVCLATWTGLIIGGIIKAIKIYYYPYISIVILSVYFTFLVF